jgi:tetratricopeptide (TPR) repeat protein
MPSLGLIMIVRDEANNLPRSLGPIASFFDQVVVLDTGSRDRTAHLARSMGAEVYHFTWQDDFALARNRSIELASADWLLWLDADNALAGPEAVAEIRSLLSPEPAVIWATERVSRSGELLGQKRVFPRRPEARFNGIIHEQLIHPPAWPQRCSQVIIEHWGYRKPEEMKRKGEYYLSLLQRSLEKNPGDYYARYQAGRCYFNLRSFGEAGRQFALALKNPALAKENPPLFIQTGLLLATALEREGETQAAGRQLSELRAACPDHPLPLLAAGRLAYLEGQYEKAVVWLQKSLSLNLGLPMIDLNPGKIRFSACYLLGLALSKLGRPLQARAALEQAVTVDPEHRGARLDSAEISWHLGERALARRQLAWVLERYPQDGRAARLARKWRDDA